MQIKSKVESLLRFPLKRVIAIAIMMIICVSSVITVIATTITAYVVDGDQKFSIDLVGNNQAEILKHAQECGLKPIQPNDLVDFNQQTNTVTIRRALTVVVNADGKAQEVIMHNGDTVQDAINSAKVSVGANDAVTPSLQTAVTQTMSVAVARKHPVIITVDGQAKTYFVPEGTVENAIQSVGISIGKDDILNAEKTAKVQENMKLVIQRVTYRDASSVQPVAFKVIKKSTATLTRGTTKEETAGINGSQTVVAREKVVDGKVVESKVLSTTVIKQPVNRVVLVGTKAKASRYATVMTDGTLIDQNGNVVKYSKYLTGRCTAYTATGNHTSTGQVARRGLIAVNPKLIPYGTKMYVCSPNGKTVYGYAVAADTGGGVMKGVILADLFYATESECRQFGVRNMRIYILD